MILRSVLVAAVVTIVACASGSRRAGCGPVPAEFLAAGEVYRDWAVQQRAFLVREARPDTPIRTEGASGCYVAEFQVVVDTNGHPIPRTAKLVRTNNTRWADAAKVVLPMARYDPAKKDGRKVQQLVRHKSTMMWATMIVPAGSAPPSRPPANSLPPSC